MEMEALDTQKVGQLFVMQYYTQMHSDASQMHRFYLDNSSFVHGGPEMASEHPVIGQKVNERVCYSFHSVSFVLFLAGYLR